MPTTAPPPGNDPSNTYISSHSNVKLASSSSLSPPSTKFTKLSNDKNSPFYKAQQNGINTPKNNPSLNNLSSTSSPRTPSSATLSPNREYTQNLQNLNEEILISLCHEKQTASKYKSKYFHAGAIFKGTQKALPAENKSNGSIDMNSISSSAASVLRNSYPELTRYVRQVGTYMDTECKKGTLFGNFR